MVTERSARIRYEMTLMTLKAAKESSKIRVVLKTMPVFFTSRQKIRSRTAREGKQTEGREQAQEDAVRKKRAGIRNPASWKFCVADRTHTEKL